MRYAWRAAPSRAGGCWWAGWGQCRHHAAAAGYNPSVAATGPAGRPTRSMIDTVRPLSTATGPLLLPPRLRGGAVVHRRTVRRARVVVSVPSSRALWALTGDMVALARWYSPGRPRPRCPGRVDARTDRTDPPHAGPPRRLTTGCEAGESCPPRRRLAPRSRRTGNVVLAASRPHLRCYRGPGPRPEAARRSRRRDHARLENGQGVDRPVSESDTGEESIRRPG
jgi:hypothetical protein